MSVEERFRQGLEKALAADAPARIGVAVSGGSDSTALLLLLAEARPGRISAATVDHGLRPEAAAEAASVAALCGAIGVSHRTLAVVPWHGAGNLQAAARAARLAALRGWAGEAALTHLALGHTRDDQAETVLLRLVRGSGVDGLGGMAPRRIAAGLVWLRPLLDLEREVLRDWLRARGAPWSEDPSNHDPRFERVEIRRTIAALRLDTARLAATAERMRAARSVLEAQAVAVAERHARVEAGDLLFDAAVLAEAEETRLRLLAGALRFVSGGPYRPRYAALKALAAELRAGRGGTLGGCLATLEVGRVRVAREAQAVAALECPPNAAWDGRWCLVGPGAPGLALRALGDGLDLCPDWRGSGLPRASLRAAPAVWQGVRLVAAPLAGLPNGWTARLAPGRDRFTDALVAR